MMINFVYYVLRMLGLGIWMILQVPRQLIQGLFAGLTDNGIIKENSRISKTVNDLSADLGLKQVSLVKFENKMFNLVYQNVRQNLPDFYFWSFTLLKFNYF